MPLPPIAVDVAPPAKDQTLVQLLLDSCSRAASPVSCVAAESADTGSVSALALVVWLPQSEGVRIQVGAKRGQQKGDWVSRQISFDAGDEEGERWTTAGFVVGTLAGRFLAVPNEAPNVEATPEPEASSVGSEASSRELKPEPEPPTSRVAEPEQHEPARLGFEGAALVGPVFDQGPWRVGGMFGIAFQGADWPLHLYTAARQSWRPQDAEVTLRVTEGELGAGVDLGSGEAWAVKARAAFAFERLYARLDDSSSSGPQTHWVLGARARVDFCWRFNDAWSVFLAPGLSVWSHKTAFVVQSEEVGQQPAVVGEALFGVRYELPLVP